mmetsp:Transcript_2258/g.9632  ORF Transcript_2258/g.9632 Transcript_2258/m.9632 type:complete len:289 (-) Transcript_2258:244-1110(-)
MFNSAALSFCLSALRCPASSPLVMPRCFSASISSAASSSGLVSSLAASNLRMLDSIELATMRCLTRTSLLCPMRHERPMACSVSAGLNAGSTRNTCVAEVRLIPTAPERMESKNTVVGGSFWNAWIAWSRCLRGMLPLMVRNPKPSSGRRSCSQLRVELNCEKMSALFDSSSSRILRNSVTNAWSLLSEFRTTRTSSTSPLAPSPAAPPSPSIGSAASLAAGAGAAAPRPPRPPPWYGSRGLSGLGFSAKRHAIGRPFSSFWSNSLIASSAAVRSLKRTNAKPLDRFV